MTGTDDIDALAAEYVLGTLDADERAAVAARRGREPALERAIAAWEQRLAPLNGGVTEVAPPMGLRDAVMARVAVQSASSANVIALTRRAARWRNAAIGMTAMAASLAGVLVYREAARPEPVGSYVAVLQKDAASPAFVMTVDIARRTLTVRPVSAQQQAGKSYELWLVHDKLGGPKSLGLVGDKPFSQSAILTAYQPGDIAEATYAVSLEPEGGSPTGAPTGPVLFAGKLVQARP